MTNYTELVERLDGYVRNNTYVVAVSHMAEASTAISTLERENRELREALQTAFDAADDLLAPVCAEAGRVFMDTPDENMTPYLPPLKGELFKRLYDTTHPDIIATLKGSEHG